MTEGIGCALALADILAVCKSDALGCGNENGGMILKYLINRRNELLRIEGYLGKVNEIGSDTVYDSADCRSTSRICKRSGSKTARSRYPR